MTPTLAQQAVALPNILTYLRIAAVPVVMFLMQDVSPGGAFAAAAVFGAASITDALDGYLARRMNLVSAIGQLLDPLADKLLVMGALLGLVQLGRVSPGLAFIILAREMYVNGLRSVAASQGVVLAARALGKQKTAFQMVGLVALILHHSYPLIGGEVRFQTVGMWCLMISVGFSLFSAAEYTWAFFAPGRSRQSRG